MVMGAEGVGFRHCSFVLYSSRSMSRRLRTRHFVCYVSVPRRPVIVLRLVCEHGCEVSTMVRYRLKQLLKPYN